MKKYSFLLLICKKRALLDLHEKRRRKSAEKKSAANVKMKTLREVKLCIY